MGIIKKALTLAAIVGAFYFGQNFNEWRTETLVERLEAQNAQMKTIEYNIVALNAAMLAQPERVEQALNSYRLLLDNPPQLEKTFRSYRIELK